MVDGEMHWKHENVTLNHETPLLLWLISVFSIMLPYIYRAVSYTILN